MRGIAQDLGVSRGTLREWLHRWGTGRKTGPDGAPAPSPLKPKTDLGDRTEPPAGESVEERVARLEAENAALRAEKTKLTREKEILQQAAKHVSPGRRSGRGRLPGSSPTTQPPMGRERLCELLEVARSSYYAWKAGAPRRAERAAADAVPGRADTADQPRRPCHGGAQDHLRTQ